MFRVPNLSQSVQGYSNGAVSVRPSAGRAYTPYSYGTNPQEAWDKIQYPGGKKLFCQLVTVFTIIASVGLTFMILGATYVGPAHAYYREHNVSIPLAFALLGLVCGFLMLVGSFVLGKLIISRKWRNGEDPYAVRYVSPRRRRSRSGSVASRRSRHSNNSGDMPPSYEESMGHEIYFINIEGMVNVLTPPNYNATDPPSYTVSEATINTPSIGVSTPSTGGVAIATAQGSPAVIPSAVTTNAGVDNPTFQTEDSETANQEVVVRSDNIGTTNQQPNTAPVITQSTLSQSEVYNVLRSAVPPRNESQSNVAQSSGLQSDLSQPNMSQSDMSQSNVSTDL
ncbi:unnamed protein product [Owenia fusiformis]|uniref:Uncharacterized protein n=1 Tax=Owenia fusiformis TaxID=6347 RepID=A0A8J1XZ44_OWEFU|nr:unnamed protein product [Owenia fusiformis]